ncbi:MAG TPA: type II secretion system F family protein [Verrucomicrobiota bacterium]|nr:type II secretion system F family protein [Verrucomicrobiota bacterium]HNU49374.1 type II secretion system F family protein [Verrucomicrobiota bacterium]
MDNPLLIVLFWLAVPVVFAGLGYACYQGLSLPVRRRERAHLLIDLLDSGLRRGESPEAIVIGAASSSDTALGLRFHLLAAHLEAGRSFPEALDRVPGFLPPGVAALLRIGIETGDVRRVLTICRERLGDLVPAVWTAHDARDYLLLLTVILGPVWVACYLMLMVFVVPKYVQIAEDMGGGQLPLLLTLAELRVPLIASQAALVFGLLVFALAYVGGPRLARQVSRIAPGLPDWLAWCIPWRRQRLQRDFSAVLSLLLDSGVPEGQAVRLAALSTANREIERRADRMRRDLESGKRLPEAVRHLDDAGEFLWRLENAAQGPGRFETSLVGWHEALTARAFRGEQVAAQVATAGLVLLNGFYVGLLAVGVHGFLIQLIHTGVLW